MVNEHSVMGVIRASRPSFRNAHDKVAFAVHASFLASGYSLLAVGPPAFADGALSSISTDEVGIDNWNELEDDYAFLYSKSKKVLVKCLSMNDELLVDALSDGDSKPLQLEINVGDYVTENDTDYGSKYKNFDKLVSIMDREILSKLNGTSKESSSTLPSSSTTRDWEVTEPQGPQLYPSRYMYPTGGFPVSGSDLLPPPGAGMYPSRGDFGTSGGMLVGPDHPAFGWFGKGRDPGLPGRLPGVPPGARFDHYGPRRTFLDLSLVDLLGQSKDDLIITLANLQSLKALKREFIDSKGFLKSWNNTGRGACW